MSYADENSTVSEQTLETGRWANTPFFGRRGPLVAESFASAIREYTTPLPGSRPYENHREIRVKRKYDRYDLSSFLRTNFPHISKHYWEKTIEAGNILLNGRPLSSDHRVRAGNIITHVIPNTVEPDVNNDIRIVYEDDCILAIDKPAPLPVHPSGRFNKNTLISFLNTVRPNLKLRIVHRLDSETTGILIMAKTQNSARNLRNQFDSKEINKTYIALVCPIPDKDIFNCSSSISRQPSLAGSRQIDMSALKAWTDFEVIHKFVDNTALLRIRPKTGRTNQIRLHLSHLGCPIVGDRLYTAPTNVTSMMTSCGGYLHLHASSIRFHHPKTDTVLELIAPNPKWVSDRIARYVIPDKFTIDSELPIAWGDPRR